MVPQNSHIIVVLWGLYPCPDCIFCIFLARFNKEFAVSGLGMVFKFQSFSWLWVLFEQPIEREMLLSKWATN